MIFTVGISLSLFLTLLLVLKKNKGRSDFFLLAWMTLIMTHLLLFYVPNSDGSYQFPHVLGLLLPMPVLHGILLFGYASEWTGNSLLKNKRNLFYLSPFILLTILAIPFYLLSGPEKITVFKEEGKGFEWYMIIQLITVAGSGLLFSFLTLKRARTYRKNLPAIYAAKGNKMLHWIESLAIGLGLIWIITLFFDDAVIFGGVVVFVLLIGILGISRVPVFYAEVMTVSPAIQETSELSEIGKYAKTGLREEDATHLLAQLEDLMLKEQPYLAPELTLNELASRLHCPPHQLSQVINSKCGMSFYHYINRFRIWKFLELSAIPENKKYTFIALAYDSGFNSKTTFNKYFKLQTGKSPSEYLD